MDESDLARIGSARSSPSARYVSGALTPANTVLGVTAYVAYRHSTSLQAAAGWWALTLAVVVGLPYLILFRSLRSGRADDRQVVRRSQRPPLMAAAAVRVAAALVALYLLGAPRALLALVLAILAGLMAMLVATRFGKPSMHVGVATGANTVVAVEQPAVGLVLALLLIPLARARIHEDGTHFAKCSGAPRSDWSPPDRSTRHSVGAAGCAGPSMVQDRPLDAASGPHPCAGAQSRAGSFRILRSSTSVSSSILTHGQGHWVKETRQTVSTSRQDS